METNWHGQIEEQRERARARARGGGLVRVESRQKGNKLLGRASDRALEGLAEMSTLVGIGPKDFAQLQSVHKEAPMLISDVVQIAW